MSSAGTRTLQLGAVTDCARRKVKILSRLQHGFVATVAVFLRWQLVQSEVHLMFAVSLSRWHMSHEEAFKI